MHWTTSGGIRCCRSASHIDSDARSRLGISRDCPVRIAPTPPCVPIGDGVPLRPRPADGFRLTFPEREATRCPPVPARLRTNARSASREVKWGIGETCPARRRLPLEGLRRDPFRMRSMPRRSRVRRAALAASIVAGLATAQLSARADVFESEVHAFRGGGGCERARPSVGTRVPAGRPDAGDRTCGPAPNGDRGGSARPGARRRGALGPRERTRGACSTSRLHPEFRANGWVYLSYAAGHWGHAPAPRSRAGGFAAAGWRTWRCCSAPSRSHRAAGATSGRASGSAPDGHLFITLGDRGRPAPRPGPGRSRREHRPAPRRRRASRPTIPFAGCGTGRSPRSTPLGNRNVQGLAFDPETGVLWSHEHGPRGGDELNVVRPGVNYGWPIISYGREYISGTPVGEGTHQDGMAQPAHQWTPSIAPSGLTVYDGDRFPAWRGNLFVGALRFRLLARLVLDGERVVHEERLLEDRYGRIRDVRTGPDGLLYLLTDAPAPLRRASSASSPPPPSEPCPPGRRRPPAPKADRPFARLRIREESARFLWPSSVVGRSCMFPGYVPRCAHSSSDRSMHVDRLTIE